MESWLEIDPESPFSLANIPFGIISTSNNSNPRPATILGEHVIDLELFSQNGGFGELPIEATDMKPLSGSLSQPQLNAFAKLGQKIHNAVRSYLQDVFRKDGPFPKVLEQDAALRTKVILPAAEIKTHLPMAVGGYTDFYAGRNHAYNIGVMFRGAANALQPNYEHLPVGYHGRPSSIVVSGTPVRRPNGQILPVGSKDPVFSPSKKFDIELELAAFLCHDSDMGVPIPIEKTAEYIFGYVLMNDWPARDIQAWEYVPLGPFLSKSFATTISPWIVLPSALEPFRAEGLSPGNRTTLLPYLREERAANVYDIDLAVDLATKEGQKTRLVETNGKHLLYSFQQMLAHHTVGGCPMRAGDLLGSGTISGLTKESRGALIEQTTNGKEPVKLDGEVERSFLQDGDVVTMSGRCGTKGAFVGFGDCEGKIIP
ncbi:hypothetical protein VF21_10095 [Pseudogymnoascus sp. 05NY08]|nr:hypothetical protein VF21_10095 [Pseudogymnoascus sp. 05NY08]